MILFSSQFKSDSMLNCYSKKCFTGIIILMLILVKTGYAATRDTTVTPGNKNADWLTGTVVNQDGNNITGAKISVQGNDNIVKTDENGHFEIKAPEGSVLVVNAPNYNVDQVAVSTDRKLKVRLLDTYLKSPDNVDVLYGSQSPESILGAISTVYTNQLTTTPASLYVYALPGQLAGLYTQQTSGFTSFKTSPLSVASFGINLVQSTSQNNQYTDNTEISLNLRGQTPITVIDGVQRDISSIDPESIESISVLKDGLSSILLGINSSRGVLLVTTKKAEAGKTTIGFTSEYGLQQSLGLPTPLPAYQWAYLYNEALTNDGAAPLYTAADFNAYKNHTDPIGHPDVNWFNTILRKTSPIQSDKLNVTGGNEVAKYSIGLSYFDQSGIFNEAPGGASATNNNLSRYIINSDVSVQVNKNLNVNLQLFGRVQQSTEPGGTDGNGTTGIPGILQTLYGTPNNAYPVYNPNGSFGGSTLGAMYGNNLLAMTEYSGTIQDNTDDILANLELNYNLNSLTKGLTLKLTGNLSYQSENVLNRSITNAAYAYNATDSSYTAVGSTAAQQNAFATVFTTRQSYAQAALNYNRQFGKSDVTALLMYDTKSLISNYDLPAVTTDRALKVSYNYDSKYFIEGAVNSSGYNRYTPGHQFGLFYAGGLGWQMGKEDFIKNNFDWISSWKWRATYGKTGNANVDQYSYYGYVQTYSTSNINWAYYTGTGRDEQFTYYENPIANPYLSWEIGNKVDFGTDISLFKNHLQITGDYYHDKYSDLLQIRGDNVALLGVPYPYENIGKDQFTGFEFSATYQNNLNKFNYFITGNISTQASKVLFDDEETPLYPWLKKTGLPVNTIFGYVADGFYENAAEAAKGAVYGSYVPKAGDIKLEDLNGDGQINQFDIAPIGGLKPLVFYGATLGFNYDGFSFSFILQGVFNRQININNNQTDSFQGLGGFATAPQGQAYTGASSRWTPETAGIAQLPELSFANVALNGYNILNSSFYIRSGDYIRLKNAEIGYTLPDTWSSRIKVSSIRVFADGENLLTLAGYGGYDPEVSPDNYPIQRVFNLGISIKL